MSKRDKINKLIWGFYQGITAHNRKKEGLNFDHTQGGVIEALRGDNKKYRALIALLTAELEVAGEEEARGAPDFKTKTQVLDEFIKSANFKRLGIPLKSPNDFFLLGYTFFSLILNERSRQAFKEFQDPSIRHTRQRRVARS